MSGPDNTNAEGEKPKAFTKADFNALKTRQASLLRQIETKQQRIEKLDAEIKSRSITRQMPDGTDPTKMHSVKEILSSGQIAAKKAERNLAKADLAQLATDLKTVEKDVKAASKQVGAAARQDAAITRAEYKAFTNQKSFLAKVIKDLTQKSNGAFAQLISRGEEEYARNPAAFRGEILAMMKDVYPTIYQLLLERPEVMDMIISAMFGPLEDPK